MINTDEQKRKVAKLSILAVILAVIIICFATACSKPTIADPRFELPAPPTVLVEPSKNLEPITEPKESKPPQN